MTTRGCTHLIVKNWDSYPCGRPICDDAGKCKIHTAAAVAARAAKSDAKWEAAKLKMQEPHARIKELETALGHLVRGYDSGHGIPGVAPMPCWCEMAIGNPNVSFHSKGCMLARAAMEKCK